MDIMRNKVLQKVIIVIAALMLLLGSMWAG